MKKGSFFISTGFDGWMLGQVSGGMAPATFAEVLVQSVTGGVLRLVAWFVRFGFDRTVTQCHQARSKKRADKANALFAAAQQEQLQEGRDGSSSPSAAESPRKLSVPSTF